MLATRIRDRETGVTCQAQVTQHTGEVADSCTPAGLFSFQADFQLGSGVTCAWGQVLPNTVGVGVIGGEGGVGGVPLFLSLCVGGVSVSLCVTPRRNE